MTTAPSEEIYIEPNDMRLPIDG